MGVREDRRHVGEQPHTAVQGQARTFAVLVDRQAVDAFDHQHRAAVIEHAAVENRGQARMLEPRQHLALAQQALGSIAVETTGARQLHHRLLFESACAAMHRQHQGLAATAEPALHRPAPQLRARHDLAFEGQRMGGGSVQQVWLHNQSLHQGAHMRGDRLGEIGGKRFECFRPIPFGDVGETVEREVHRRPVVRIELRLSHHPAPRRAARAPAASRGARSFR